MTPLGICPLLSLNPPIGLARWAQFVAELEERARAALADVLVVAVDADPVATDVHAVSERNRLWGAEFFVLASAQSMACDRVSPPSAP